MKNIFFPNVFMIEYIANILNNIFNVKNFEEKAFNTSSLPYVRIKAFFIIMFLGSRSPNKIGMHTLVSCARE